MAADLQAWRVPTLQPHVHIVSLQCIRTKSLREMLGSYYAYKNIEARTHCNIDAIAV